MLNKLNIVTERVGFPGGSVGKEILGQENPLEKDIATHSSILPCKERTCRQRLILQTSLLVWRETPLLLLLLQGASP